MGLSCGSWGWEAVSKIAAGGKKLVSKIGVSCSGSKRDQVQSAVGLSG